ncbi:MAG: cation:proton antiporter [Woeseia sp.]
MSNATWFLIIGAILLFMALTAARIKSLPLSTAIVYLGVGVVLGPSFANLFHFNPVEHSALLEIITEVAVIVSLFAAGLKLAAPMGARIWWVPFRLATVSMVTTVGLTALVGVALLDLPLGAAVLLGAILAPTDPVLATDVQIRDSGDDDRLRFALTGEAGLNDGTAFPMVMLGLGLLGLHDVGDHFSRWWLVDVLWASASGVGVGAALGAGTAWVTRRLVARGIYSEFTEDFLGLGLIALSYGLSILLLGYGFLAVFAAGFVFHRTEMRFGVIAEKPKEPVDENHPASGSSESGTHMGNVTLGFVEQLERLGEVVLLILLGGMLFADSWQVGYVAVAVILIFVIRPISVLLGLIGSEGTFATKATIGWFGVRGIGSLYYLMYAIQHGLETSLAVTLVSVVLIAVTMSILLHGITVTPVMRLYSRRQQ